MKKSGKILKKYLLVLMAAMVLVLFNAGSAFATEAAEAETETDAPVSGEQTEKMLELARSVRLELEKSTVVYSGSAIEVPVKRIYYVENDQEVDAGDQFIISDPVYANNCNVTTAENPATVSVDITGYYEKDADGIYVTDESGEKVTHLFDEPVRAEASFMIEAADISQVTELKLGQTSFTYNGKEQKPDIILSNTALVEGTDYSVTYTNSSGEADSCINAGKKTVTVAGKGNYQGKLTASYDINQADLAKVASMSLSATSYTFDGKAHKPAVTVTVGSEKLSSGSYTVEYTNTKGQAVKCIDAGSRIATVTGKGNYKGTLSADFTIKPKSISSASVTLSTSTYAYNGKDRKPGVTVKIKLSSTVTLNKDKNYTVSYSSNCKSIGSKTVTIKGKGNYTGSVKAAYKVVPEKGSGLKVSKRGTGSLTVQCTKAKVSGCKYQFLIKNYNSSKEKWENVASKKTSSNSVTFSDLDAGRLYAVYVRVYKTIDSKTYTGAWSGAMKTVTTPAKPVMSYATKTGSKSMKAVWKAVSIASGYEIQYSTKSDFSSNVKTVKVSGRKTTSKTISNLGSAKAYYVRVRAYRTYNDKTYRGAWSSKVSTYYSNVYASYSTTYNSGNKNRTTNLRLACNAINGKILTNGQTFSFNGTVGERTKAKGYKEAVIYENGQEVGGIGGGICQVATTLFNAALKANFKIVERHQHSLTVHYCPLGYDAAIAWGSKNLRFTNNSGTNIKIDIHAAGGTLSAKFLTNIYKKPPKVTTKVTVKNGVYTLKRYVNGKVNYTTKSDYLDN